MITIINKTQQRVPQKFLNIWIHKVYKELIRLNEMKEKKELTVVFVSKGQIRKLNSQYRNKNKPTDILSFESMDPESLGELVICPQIIKKQSKEHGLTLQEEMSYMVLHGILHLLGYDHEVDEKQARQMFALQDSIFKKLI